MMVADCEIWWVFASGKRVKTGWIGNECRLSELV